MFNSYEANKNMECPKKTEPPKSREERIASDKERLKSLDKEVDKLEEAKGNTNDKHQVKELQKEIDQKRAEMQEVGQRIDRLQAEEKAFHEKYGSSIKR